MNGQPPEETTGPEPPPGNVIGQISITAEAEVVPGPQTLAQQGADEDGEP